jgi:hypothetical protein
MVFRHVLPRLAAGAVVLSALACGPARAAEAPYYAVSLNAEGALEREAFEETPPAPRPPGAAHRSWS